MNAPSVLVLVAEDDKALNMVHRSMLEDEGIDMKMAETGEDAVKAIDEMQPDLLLLDLLMPGMDGFAVLKHIKEKGYTFPTVVLTNLSSEKDRHECMNLGATEVYVKSETDVDQLKKIVRKYVKKD